MSRDAVIEALQKVSSHPMAFGVAIGIGNGLLAEGRSLPFTPRSAVITALVIAGGEAALAAEVSDRKYALVEIAAYSVAGTLIGLWPFVGQGGSPSLVQASVGRPALT